MVREIETMVKRRWILVNAPHGADRLTANAEGGKSLAVHITVLDLSKEPRNNYCFKIALVLISFEVQKWSVNCCAYPKINKERPRPASSLYFFRDSFLSAFLLRLSFSYSNCPS